MNASDDFLALTVTSHFLALCMQKLGMKSLDDVPMSGEFDENTWMLSDDDRKSALYSFCQTIIDENVKFSMIDDISCSGDGVTNYAIEVMSLGIFYLNYKDAVREDDGDRVLVCWKYLLPLFKVSDRRNYSLEVHRMLYSYYFTMSPRQKHQLLWSRFVNVHGKVGRNIANDLHMEHLNRVCKNAVRGIGAKKSEESLKRIGRVVGPLAEVMSNFDQNVLKTGNDGIGHHKRAAADKDRDMIVNELLNRADVFAETENRFHRHFKNMTNKGSIFMNVNRKTLEKWIKENVVVDGD